MLEFLARTNKCALRQLSLFNFKSLLRSDDNMTSCINYIQREQRIEYKRIYIKIFIKKNNMNQ